MPWEPWGTAAAAFSCSMSGMTDPTRSMLVFYGTPVARLGAGFMLTCAGAHVNLDSFFRHPLALHFTVACTALVMADFELGPAAVLWVLLQVGFYCSRLFCNTDARWPSIMTPPPKRSCAA